MVAALNKITGGNFAGRFAAWWNGQDYVPGQEPVAESKPKAKPVSAPVSSPSETSGPVLSSAESRISALETLWGEGRFSPAGGQLYARVTENLPELEKGALDRFGVINTDPAWLTQLISRLGCCPVISEWRPPCETRFGESHPDFDVISGDLDRPTFTPESLQMVFSQDAFAFADHKSGLAVRVWRSLKPGSQWLVLDTVRGNAKGNLSPAFASSWAEPQLCRGDEIVEICESAGFELARDEDDVTGDVVQAYRSSIARFSDEMETRLPEQLKHVNKAVFMQELGWEAESWKWRQRALAGELVHVKLWKFRKPAN
ncbi:MAG: hypothetical protein CMK09_14270 [Ponticaulis sp.]|nr:hypothetical protein [Ponticaulis sp.]|tara:strand:+ start:70835 stop:71779 length:945 start_codon:yes stop_codon:yes gene_type:complete